MIQISSHNWHRLWARKYSPFLSSIFISAFLKNKKFFSVCSNKLFIPEGKLNAIYFRSDEFSTLIKKFTNKLLRSNLNEYELFYKNLFLKYYLSGQRLNKIDYQFLSKAELKELLNKIFTDTIESAEWQFSAFVATEGLAKEVEQKLSLLPNGERILLSLSAFARETLINRAKKELLEIAIFKNSRYEKIKNYTKKYCWLPMYEFCDNPWTVEDFKNQLSQIKYPAFELKELNKSRHEGLKIYKKYLSTLTDKTLKKKIEAVRLYFYLKELRDDYRRRYYYLLLPFWHELERRLGISVYDLNHLLLTEIEALLSGQKISKKIIQDRKRKYAIIMEKGKLFVLAGSSAQKLEKKFSQPALNHKLFKIKGKSASRGKIIGRVRLIYHQGEFKKFKTDEILVTVMTHPEFLSIMKRAKAIVTDEGGITCHAAIVARELNIPCVIGTKIATQVFNDGDLVEVDADKGIVRKIK